MISNLPMYRTARLAFNAILFAGVLCAASAADRKMEARLVWGTNDDKSPEPSHKPLDGELAKKLREMPLKWKNYFEVNRKTFIINDQTYTNVVMSKQSSIEMKDKGGNNVTVKLYGQGKPVNRVDKPLPKGDVLTIGGDAKNNSAWFIMVRPVDGDGKSALPMKDPVIAKPVPAK